MTWRCGPLLLVMACAGHQTVDVDAANNARFDASFDVVFEAVRDTVIEHARGVEVVPRHAMIQTAWQQVEASPTTERGPVTARPSGPMALSVSQMPATRSFIRFDVQVIGGRPWQVRVTGHAAKWVQGSALPVELHGADEPGWLALRSDALRVEIYKRIKRYAVPAGRVEPARTVDVAVEPDAGIEALDASSPAD